MRNNEYKMLSGLDLAMMEFPEDKFIIQDLVPKGLVILSAELLDTGRSLAMDMSMRVAKGEKLWKMDTRQGAVLYMIHHYALATARNLIMDMTVRIPDDFYVGVMIEDSLELALTGVKSFVKNHDNVSMVVIEMRGMVEQFEDAVYVPADTLPQYMALREFALEHGIAVMVVLTSDTYHVSRGKVSDEDLNCVTDKSDGHIDMCVLNGDNTEAMLRVVTPPRDPKLWSTEYHRKNHHWEERNESDHP